MSEEIKDIFECLKKYANLTPDAIDDLYYLEGTIEDLQQKVEQLEKENFQLKMEWALVKSALDTSEKRVEQLENIRKEAIDFIEWHYKDNKEFFKNKGIGLNYPECDALLNILNKGDNNGK